MFAFDYSEAAGAGAGAGVLTNERVLYQHDGPGEPDGHRVDVDGNVWTAVYGESCVLKLSPQGRLLGRVALPTRNVTCVEFVGSELFITTAAMGEADGTPDEVALSGALFRVDVGTTGLEPHLFKMAPQGC